MLVIDDDADIREGWVIALTQAGFPAVGARNGFEALQLLHDGMRPCLILMDLMMPVMNGFEFREQQMTHPDLAAIPVIACSGVTDPEKSASHIGASALVHKPTPPEYIVELVRQYALK